MDEIETGCADRLPCGHVVHNLKYICGKCDAELTAALTAAREERDEARGKLERVIHNVVAYCEYRCRDTAHCEGCFLKHSTLTD